MTSSRVRLITAVVLSVIGLGALLVVSIRGDGDGRSAVPPTTTPPQVSTSSTPPDGASTTSVSIPDEWHPKGSSLYSDREPTDTMAGGGEGDVDDGAPEDVVEDRRGRR